MEQETDELAITPAMIEAGVAAKVFLFETLEAFHNEREIGDKAFDEGVFNVQTLTDYIAARLFPMLR